MPNLNETASNTKLNNEKNSNTVGVSASISQETIIRERAPQITRKKSSKSEKTIQIVTADDAERSTNQKEANTITFDKLDDDTSAYCNKTKYAIEEANNIMKDLKRLEDAHPQRTELDADVNAENERPYDQKDYMDTGSGVTTRAATKEKESKGVLSTIVNAGNKLYSAVIGKKDTEGDDAEKVAEDEARQGNSNELDFQRLCAMRGDDEVVCKFQVLLAEEYGFNPAKDNVFIKGLDVTKSDSWKARGVQMKVQKKAPKSGPMKGVTWLVGFTTLPKACMGKKVAYKYFIEKEDKGLFEELRPEGPYHGIWNRVLSVPHNFKNEFYDQFDDAIVMRNFDRRDYRKKATKCFLPSFKQIVRDHNVLNLKEMVERTENVFEHHATGIMLRKEKGSGHNYGWESDEPALKAYDRECKEHAENLANQLFEVLSNNIQKIERSNGDLVEISKLVEASVFLALFYVLCESKIHRFMKEITGEHLDLLVTALRPMMMTNAECFKMNALQHILNTPEKRYELCESFESGWNNIMKAKSFKEMPESIISVLPAIHFLRGAMSTIPIAEALKDQKKSRFWGFFSLSNPTLTTAVNSQTTSMVFSTSVFEDMKAWSVLDPLLSVSYLRCLKFDDFITLLNTQHRSDFWELNILLAAATSWLNEDSKFMTSMTRLSEAMKACFLPQVGRLDAIKETLTIQEVNDLEVIMKQATMATMKNCQGSQNFNSLCKVLEVLVSVYCLIFSYGPIKEDDNALDPLLTIVTMVIEQIQKTNIGDPTKKLISMSTKLSLIAEVFKPLENYTKIFLVAIMSKCQEELHTTKKDDIVIEVYTGADFEKFHPEIKMMIEERSLRAMDIPNNNSVFNQMFAKVKNWVLGGKIDNGGKYANLVERAFTSSAKEFNLSDKVDVLTFVLKSPAVCKVIEHHWLVEHFSTKGKKFLKGLMLSFGSSISEVLEGKVHVAMLKPFQEAQEVDIESRIKLHNTYTEGQGLPSNTLDILRLRHQELEKYMETTSEVLNFLQILNGRKNISLQDAIASFKSEADIQSSVLESLWKPRTDKFQEIQIRIPFISRRAQNVIHTFVDYSKSQIFRNLYEGYSKSGDSSDGSSEEFISADEDDDDIENETGANRGIKIKISCLLGQVANPSIAEFERVYQELNSLELSLTMVDIYFKDFKKDPEGLREELKVISTTPHFLPYIENTESKWTTVIFTKVHQRLQMSEFKSTANMILGVKKSLGITTEFPEVNKIADVGKEGEDSSATLSSVSSDDIKFGRLFSEWTSADVRSIRELERCQALIRWLRDHMHNYQVIGICGCRNVMNILQEFKFFVDLASISAGESDEEVDRVMFMQAAVTAYSSFIFDLKPDSSLADFLAACQVS